MRARRREINIFNMSLLDILCGALGAFCFMMLVALPYYIPPGSGLELRKAQSETDRLLKELGEMKLRLPDQKSTEEMEELMRQLEAQVKALQGRLNILTAEKEQMESRLAQLQAEKDELQQRAQALQAEKDQLQQRAQALQAENENLSLENQNLKNRLAAKKTFTFLARADNLTQRLDLLLLKPSQMEKSPNPIFQNWIDGKFDHMHNIRNALLTATGIGLAVQEEAPPNSEGLLFVRLMNTAEDRKQTEMYGVIVGDETIDRSVRLPKATLTPERFWTLLGTVAFDQSSQPSFKEATEAEREEVWKKLTGADAPPMPTPTPPPSAADRAAAEALRAKNRERGQKFQRLMQSYMLPTTDQGEVLKQVDELLKEMPPGAPMRRELQRIREHAEAELARNKQTPAASPAP